MLKRALDYLSENDRSFQFSARYNKQIGPEHIRFEIVKSVNHDYTSIAPPSSLHLPARNESNTFAVYFLMLVIH